ncbi:unnamed protein product, partial [Iphiclides podalirius]
MGGQREWPHIRSGGDGGRERASVSGTKTDKKPGKRSPGTGRKIRIRQWPRGRCTEGDPVGGAAGWYEGKGCPPSNPPRADPTPTLPTPTAGGYFYIFNRVGHYPNGHRRSHCRCRSDDKSLLRSPTAASPRSPLSAPHRERHGGGQREGVEKAASLINDGSVCGWLTAFLSVAATCNGGRARELVNPTKDVDFLRNVQKPNQRSFSLDERFLYSQGEVRRVHWHPSSLSHVLVLLSDNTIRLYNIALKSGPKLAKVIAIGPKPCSQLAGRTILDSLGDTAVDFTPLPDSDSLLVLRGDGEVYMVQCSLDAKSGTQPRLSGPLPIYPPADDNYGSESCCIGVLGSGDALVVLIATCSATIYHCVLLPAAAEEDGEGYALYVIECVELGTQPPPSNVDPSLPILGEMDPQHSYPVHIYPCGGSTYACVHASGVHTVTLPALQRLRHYLAAETEEAEGLVGGVCAAGSRARHVARTGRAPPGLAAVRANSPALLLLCPDGALIARSLEAYDLEEQLYKEMQLKKPDMDQDDLNNLLKEKQKLSFTSIIQEVLARESSQPILHLDHRAQHSHQDCLELLSQATSRLRGEYMARQERAGGALQRKALALRRLADHHAAWRRDLLEEIGRVKEKAKLLKEKRALAEKHQEDLKYRCSAVVRLARCSMGPSAAERELLAELQRHRRSGDALQQQLQTLRQHAHHKSTELKKWHEEYKKKDTALGKSHSDTISSILQQQTSQISSLIEETKLLKDQLSIV